MAHDHLVEHAGETVLIAAAVDVSAPGRLLRTHVGWRADDCPGLREVLVPGRRDRSSDAEVSHDRAVAGEHDVFGLDVAMHHSLFVRVGQRVRHVGRNAHGVSDRELFFSVESVAQRLALNVRHHVVEEASGGARVVQRQDVRMLQPRGRFDLEEEPVGPESRREFGVQHLMATGR
jgi:hypothetical protein